MPPEVGKTKGGFTVSAFENQSDNESSTSNKTFTKLFEKFDKRMSEMENQLKSLTVHIQRQGLDNILHNRYLRFKKCKEKNLSDYAGIASNIVQKTIPHLFVRENRETS